MAVALGILSALGVLGIAVASIILVIGILAFMF